MADDHESETEDDSDINPFRIEPRENDDNNVAENELDIVMNEAHSFIDSCWVDAVEPAERDNRKYD